MVLIESDEVLMQIGIESDEDRKYVLLQLARVRAVRRKAQGKHILHGSVEMQLEMSARERTVTGMC